MRLHRAIAPLMEQYRYRYRISSRFSATFPWQSDTLPLHVPLFSSISFIRCLFGGVVAPCYGRFDPGAVDQDGVEPGHHDVAAES